MHSLQGKWITLDPIPILFRVMQIGQKSLH